MRRTYTYIVICILLLSALVGVVIWEYSHRTNTVTTSTSSTAPNAVSTGLQDATPTTLSPLQAPPPASGKPTTHPTHTNITATVFWVGEPIGNGSSENNAVSAWDDAWQKHFGCFDNPEKRTGYFPTGCTPKENPFYLDLPYNDFTNDGDRKPTALQIVPWAKEKAWGENESLMKNRWVKITKGSETCYGQLQDAGPYEYDDARYVFGTKDERPKSTEANNAGMDVSPALRDCLKFEGINNDENTVSWQFVKERDVPTGPWKQIVTTRQIYWK